MLCHRYWPEEGSELYHIYEVTDISQRTETLRIQRAPNKYLNDFRAFSRYIWSANTYGATITW